MVFAFVLVAFFHVGARSEEPESSKLKLSEAHVVLSRVHPVISDNFPEFPDHATAASLIQTHESRVSHHHVTRLRDAHGILRTVQEKAGSLSQIPGPGKWFTDLF